MSTASKAAREFKVGADAGPLPATAKKGSLGRRGRQGRPGRKGDPWTAGGTLPPGATEKGAWVFNGTTAGEEIYTPISFNVPLAVSLDENTCTSFLAEEKGRAMAT
jgi:hypothetical protein